MLYTTYPFTLPPLPYPYDALEPVLSREILEVHHDKHFKGYIDKLNATLKNCPELQRYTLNTLLKNAERFRPDVRTSVIDNGGGVYNHNLYFEILSPSSNAALPYGNLGKSIMRDFGSFDKFREEFTNCAKKVFGSGYTFLVKDSRGFLKIVNTPDQITPITCGLCPVLAFDLWEHAYYLQYLNRRDEYVENLWKVINWNKAEECYMQ